MSWSALKQLYLSDSNVKDDVLTTLNLPALERLDFNSFSFGHQGDVLEPDQLCCSQLTSLAFDLHSREAQANEGGRQCCSLLHLPRLATLRMSRYRDPATRIDLDLPSSLQHLAVGSKRADSVNLEWVLAEAVKGISSGARLCSVTCSDALPSPHPEGVPWGASSVAHYRDLGQQLRGLQTLAVHGRATTLLGAVGAVACSAPDLTRLEFRVEERLDDLELPPISSATLKSVTGRYSGYCPFEPYPRAWRGHKGPAPPIILTFLPGCTRLHDVRVHCDHKLQREGALVEICCHCSSQDCIIPLDACTGLVGSVEVGVQFLPMPPSSQGVQPYTVIYKCQAAGPEQALKWGHVVMPGVL